MAAATRALELSPDAVPRGFGFGFGEEVKEKREGCEVGRGEKAKDEEERKRLYSVPAVFGGRCLLKKMVRIRVSEFATGVQSNDTMGSTRQHRCI
jgi:hypothetical protein